MPGGYLEQRIFSKDYRAMVALLKKIMRQDIRDEEKLGDIRTSEGSGRQGSASRPASIPKSRQPRRNSGTQPGQADNEEKKDSDSGTAAAADATV